MYLPEPTGANFAPAPTGTHVARCIRFVDLGSHDQSFQGQAKGLKRLVMLTFELPTETMEDGRPFTVSKRYTWSMHEKSVLRKHLEAWRSRPFEQRDFGPGGFDIRNVLGKACMLTVSHTEREGQVYSNLEFLSPLMKGLSVPAQINPSVFVSLEPALFDQKAFDSLSDKIKATIMSSPEWDELRTGGAPMAAESAEYMEDIPF
jgi:hypothetical protein